MFSIVIFSIVIFSIDLFKFLLNKHTGKRWQRCWRFLSTVSHWPWPSCSNSCLWRLRWHSLLSHCMRIYKWCTVCVWGSPPKVFEDSFVVHLRKEGCEPLISSPVLFLELELEKVPMHAPKHMHVYQNKVTLMQSCLHRSSVTCVFVFFYSDSRARATVSQPLCPPCSLRPPSRLWTSWRRIQVQIIISLTLSVLQCFLIFRISAKIM